MGGIARSLRRRPAPRLTCRHFTMAFAPLLNFRLYADRLAVGDMWERTLARNKIIEHSLPFQCANRVHGGEGGSRTPETSHPVCRISSAVHSATLPPLQVVDKTGYFRFRSAAVFLLVTRMLPVTMLEPHTKSPQLTADHISSGCES